MIEQNNELPSADNRARVSIMERLVPSLGFALAAISGSVGAGLTLKLFRDLRNDELAGVTTVATALLEIDLLVGGMLIAAIALLFAGLIVSAIRLLNAVKTSSPFGLLYLIVGGVSLISPAVLIYAFTLIATALADPQNANMGATGGTISQLILLAFAASAVAIFLLLAFSFIPFKAKLGRKFSPLICLVLMIVATAVVSGSFFLNYQTAQALTENDRRK